VSYFLSQAALAGRRPCLSEEAEMAIDPQAALTAEEPLRRYDRFVALVSDLASLSLAEAEIAIRAVIETTAEHLPDDERRTLASRLPKAVRPWLTEPGAGEQLRHGAFLYRVAEREGIIVERHDRIALKTAERHTRAVFELVRLVLLPDEVDALAERLPDEARKLLRESEPRPRPVVSADAFLERVANAARFDHERALRATEAVLETLAERLAPGEVDDLETLLPGELRPALELGKLHSGGKAERFGVDEFVGRVADRVGETSHDEALDDARFVFRALGETLPRQELDDILAELPREYDDLLGR
jgi:uncharacterized protein (DUF2267 family)